jgi:hypothetical protein
MAFDLRNVNGTNWLLPVRNHHLPLGSDCASCWAVTTATVLGVRINMALREGTEADAEADRIEVSAQVLLNCVPGQKVCGFPGSSGAALEYVMANGVPHESCAPWQNAAMPCDAIHTCAAMGNPPRRHHNGTLILEPVHDPTRYYVESILRIAQGDIARMKAELVLGPLACGIHAEGLLNYTSGVLMQSKPPLPTGDDHSVAIVGWGQTADGLPYWSVQNNWSVCLAACTCVSLPMPHCHPRSSAATDVRLSCYQSACACAGARVGAMRALRRCRWGSIYWA